MATLFSFATDVSGLVMVLFLYPLRSLPALLCFWPCHIEDACTAPCAASRDKIFAMLLISYHQQVIIMYIFYLVILCHSYETKEKQEVYFSTLLLRRTFILDY